MSVDRLLFAGLPATLTLLLHGGLLLMLVVRWSGANEVVAAAPAIQPIQATLVQAETLKPKPKPKPQTQTQDAQTQTQTQTSACSGARG